MRQVLLVLHQFGLESAVQYALIPESELAGYNLDDMDNKDVNDDNFKDDKTADQMVEIFERCGFNQTVIPGPGKAVSPITDEHTPHEPDWVHYLKPSMPMVVDRIVTISWPA